MLANLFMHYAFDKWLEREFPAVEFERYADDAVVHCATEQQAAEGACRPGREDGRGRAATAPGQDQDRVLQGQEPAALGLRAHVVHLPRLHVPRQAGPDPGREAACSAAFLPAVSKDALKKMSEEVRSWRIHLRTATDLEDLAAWINPVVRGWMTYYGRFYRTALNGLLQRINTYLVRWARRKYKRLRTFKKARRWWDGLTARQPRLFAHWAWMTDFRTAIDGTSGVTGDCHAPFCGSPGVRFPRATRRR